MDGISWAHVELVFTLEPGDVCYEFVYALLSESIIDDTVFASGGLHGGVVL